MAPRDLSETSGNQPLLNYASGIHPPVQGEESTDNVCYRAAELLVAFNGATLPPRCILCGKDGFAMPIKLSFTWDSSFTMTRISTLQLRQQAYVHAYLCAAHRTRWRTARVFGGIAVLVNIALMMAGSVLAVASESSAVPAWTSVAIAMILVGFAGTIVALFFFTLRTRTMQCRRIQEGYLYLEGASAAFLREMPEIETAP